MLDTPAASEELRTGGVDFRFYFGAASGSARRALQQAGTASVCLSYATEHNEPWSGIDNLLIDSGGYSFVHGIGTYPTTATAYLDYIAEHDPEVWALRDIPCDSSTRDELGESVAGVQAWTTHLHGHLLDQWRSDYSADAQPMAVAQGWHPEQYVTHLDDLADAGCLTDYVGIGSLVEQSPDQAAAVIERVDEALSSRHDLHAFGLKTDVLRRPGVAQALTSADSAAYEKTTRMEEHDRSTDGRSWRDLLFHYLRYRRGIEDILHDVAAQAAASATTAQASLTAWEATTTPTPRPDVLPDRATEDASISRGPPPCQEPGCRAPSEPSTDYLRCFDHA